MPLLDDSRLLIYISLPIFPQFEVKPYQVQDFSKSTSASVNDASVSHGFQHLIQGWILLSSVEVMDGNGLQQC